MCEIYRLVIMAYEALAYDTRDLRRIASDAGCDVDEAGDPNPDRSRAAVESIDAESLASFIGAAQAAIP